MSSDASAKPLVIAMVAGEASGDNLGAPLVRELLKAHPNARIFGVGGPAMIAEGFDARYDLAQLSVNGFIDPLLKLPTLLKMLYSLRAQILAAEVDCFVGIDFNFFNLLLEGMLKKRGVRTLHYVSPTVWAWRRSRLNKIARSVDLMMTIFPFEVDIYRQRGIDVACVGHPLAVEISPEEGQAGQQAARQSLGISDSQKVVAILPGSRAREVDCTGRDFIATARLLADEVDWFVIPAANEQRRVQIAQLLDEAAGQDSEKTFIDKTFIDKAFIDKTFIDKTFIDKTRVVTGGARQVMTAADVVMVNSGTATLEALLLRKPMIMSYRLGPLTYALVSRMVTTKWFALPNILAGRQMVKEFLQADAVPARMAEEVRRLLTQPDMQDILPVWDGIHEQLRAGGVPGASAATTVLGVCNRLGKHS